MDDVQTRDYFDRFTPSFNPRRLEFALDHLARHGKPDDRLIDVGCGDGMNLARIREGTAIANLWGLDVSASYLEKVERELGCHTEWGSIVDPLTVEPLAGRFDWVVMFAVLHHLIDRTRSGSRAAARAAVANALALLRPGGRLLLFEPTYEPRAGMFAVFWAKRAIGSLTRSRVELGRAWANLGQPVVSYYSAAEVAAMVGPEGEIEDERVLHRSRIFGALRHAGVGWVIRRR